MPERYFAQNVETYTVIAEGTRNEVILSAREYVKDNFVVVGIYMAGEDEYEGYVRPQN